MRTFGKLTALVALICAMSVIGLVACNNGSSTPMPTPTTVTKDVTAKAIPVTVGVACVSIDFAPDDMLTPDGSWDDNFKAADVTYKLSDDKGHSTDNGDFAGGVVAASIYAKNDTPTITQTFYYNGTAIGTRSVCLSIDKATNNYIADVVDNYDDWHSLTAIPAKTLTLSKTL
jgi:hypothetical protein